MSDRPPSVDILLFVFSFDIESNQVFLNTTNHSVDKEEVTMRDGTDCVRLIPSRPDITDCNLSTIDISMVASIVNGNAADTVSYSKVQRVNDAMNRRTARTLSNDRANQVEREWRRQIVGASDRIGKWGAERAEQSSNCAADQ